MHGNNSSEKNDVLLFLVHFRIQAVYTFDAFYLDLTILPQFDEVSIYVFVVIPSVYKSFV